MNVSTRLLISHYEGDRTSDDYTMLIEDVERKRNINTPIPIYISDNWDAIEDALVNVYSMIEQPTYKGRGRKPLPKLIPFRDLKYAQVCKKREKNRIVGVMRRIIFGDKIAILNSTGRHQILVM